MKPWGVIITSFILSFTLTAAPVMAGTMYATTGVNVRKLPSLEAEVVETISTGDQVEVVTVVERDRSWAIVEHDGVLRAICADYLSETKPEPPEPAMDYYGECRITFYCPGSCCCGQWAGAPTASGATPTAGWTVANGSLPFGTQVVIDGHTYCVEDRGVGSDQFDIFVNDHSEALARGLYYTDVYLVR